MTIWDEIDTIYNQAGENGEDACTFSVPGTFSGYRGHFPGNPILPGIVQLSFIRRLAERRLARPLRLAGVRRIKYLRLITPETLGRRVTQTAPDHAGHAGHARADT